jgi:hypothetical protein
MEHVRRVIYCMDSGVARMWDVRIVSMRFFINKLWLLTEKHFNLVVL